MFSTDDTVKKTRYALAVDQLLVELHLGIQRGTFDARSIAPRAGRVITRVGYGDAIGVCRIIAMHLGGCE